VRPTDENQAPSMRPNLMSPKRERTSGEDSILAMLERDPLRRRGTGKGVSSLRLACYGASAVVVLVLTGTLVLLAADNDGKRLETERVADAGKAVVRVALAPDAAPPARHGSAAVIVDQQPDGVPPLRLLKPSPAAPAKTPPPAPVKPAAKPAPVATAGIVAPRPRPPAISRNTPRTAPAKAPRPAAVRSTEAPVDPDVALISAVIVHANGHAPENTPMTELLCPNDNCQSRPNRQ